jgi:hypothetical protein
MKKLTRDLVLLLATADAVLDRLTKDGVRSERALICPPMDTSGRSTQLPRSISRAMSGNLSYF